ncbi:DUF2141 domain-containing protein [bacterium]|nr:DUF2141 domain-containing protein [bacterium]
MLLRPIFFIVLCSYTLFTSSESNKVTLNISGIETEDGHLQVAVFENQSQFDDEKAVKVVYFNKNGMVNGTKTVLISLKPGTYAVTVLDDEDDSKDMTYRLGVYPLEGVGFSEYVLQGMSRPDFTDFDFTVKQTGAVVQVKMQYF